MAEKILIVDDDLETLRLIGLMLERQGFEIAASSDGSQALLLAKNNPPDLILLDVMMPNLDGLELTRRLRSEAATKDVPIIMFTAKTQVEDKILGFEAGADAYLTKPTQPRELIAQIKAVLTRTKRSGPVTSPPTRERGYVIGVMAVRGGLGVSTLALNLGVSLYNSYKREVIVAEFRPGQGSISQELGYLHPEGLNRLLQCSPAEIQFSQVEAELSSHPSGVRFMLASPRPRDAQYVDAVAHFEAITRHLAYMARFIIIDLGVSLTPLAEKIAQQCDEVIVVVEPVPQTLIQSKALVEDLVQKGIGEGRINVVLINRIRSGMQLSWSQVQEQLKRNISVIFTPAPELAYQASLQNLPMINQQPDSLTTQQFAKLAEKIVQRSR